MNVMKDVLKKLDGLCDAEANLVKNAQNNRKEQLELCEQEIIGKCFRRHSPSGKPIKGEYYGQYLCFTKKAPVSLIDNSVCLKATAVSFYEITDFRFDYGVQILEESRAVVEWLGDLDNAEQISYDEFKAAFDRASAYLFKEAQCAKAN